MKKKRTLKGFTLVELIIVMALFSLVMFSVAQLLSPVSKFYVRTSNFESSTACVDNMKRAIEGNLKYADRVRVYSNFDPATSLNGHVKSFWEEFFKDRKVIDCKGTIYAMVFSNEVPSLSWDGASNQWVINGYSTLQEFTAAQANSGKITLYQYNFDTSTDPTVGPTQAGAPTDWYVNQKMYGSFEYQFSLGQSTATPGPTPYFDPADCTITISAYEVKRDHTNNVNRLTVEQTAQHNTASFSMKNVLDPATAYNSPLSDQKVVLSSAGMGVTYDITGPKRYVIESDTVTGAPINHMRYAPMVPNTFDPAVFPPTFGGQDISRTNASVAGFYFIYTLPDSVQDERDDEYMNKIDQVFNP